MFTQTQDFAALGQAQLDKAMRLSSIVLSGAERIATLQLELSRQLLADSANNLKQLSQIKDPKALAEYQSQLAQPSVDQAFAVARSVYDVATATQAELNAFVEEQVSEGNKVVLNSLDKLAKNSPAGSDVAINAIKTFVNTSSAAFESVSKTAKKVGAEFAEASVEAATNTAKATSAAVARAKKPAATAA